MQNGSPEKDAAAVRLGLICGVLAYAMWGMLPLYLKQLGGVNALEIVGHRIIWSVPFGAAIIACRTCFKRAGPKSQANVSPHS